jgi:hypothetical protein
MLRLKEPIKKLFYNELFYDTRNDGSIPKKSVTNKDDWQCLADIKRVLQPFKEGQVSCEGQTFVTTSLVPIFVKTIIQELEGTKGVLEQQDEVSPFNEDSNRTNLLHLIQRMIIDFEDICGSGMTGTFLEENEVMGRSDRPKGTKKTHLMAFVYDPGARDFSDHIPAQDN